MISKKFKVGEKVTLKEGYYHAIGLVIDPLTIADEYRGETYADIDASMTKKQLRVFTVSISDRGIRLFLSTTPIEGIITGWMPKDTVTKGWDLKVPKEVEAALYRKINSLRRKNDLKKI